MYNTTIILALFCKRAYVTIYCYMIEFFYSMDICAFAHVVRVTFANEGCVEKHSRTGSGISNEVGCKSLKRTLQLQPKILLWS